MSEPRRTASGYDLARALEENARLRAELAERRGCDHVLHAQASDAVLSCLPEADRSRQFADDIAASVLAATVDGQAWADLTAQRDRLRDLLAGMARRASSLRRDLASAQETVAVLSDPEMMAAIREGDEASAASASEELLLVRCDGRMSGRVTIGHSRLPATTILGCLAAGHDAEAVARAYPSVTAVQVEMLRQLRRYLVEDAPPGEAGVPQVLARIASQRAEDERRHTEHVAAGSPGILWCAMRYALGRATYAVGEVCDAILVHAHRLPGHSRQEMAREIDQAIAQHRAGWDCDVRDWQRAAAVLRDPPPAPSLLGHGQHEPTLPPPTGEVP